MRWSVSEGAELLVLHSAKRSSLFLKRKNNKNIRAKSLREEGRPGAEVRYSCGRAQQQGARNVWAK